MVSAADLVRASEHLQVLRALTATTAADTVAMAGDVTRLGDATDWWLGPQGDDLRAGLAQLADDARAAVAPLESLATTVQGLQTTAVALAAELFVLERRRAAAQDVLSRLWRAARSTVEDVFGVDAGVAEEEASLARIEQAITEVERRWTLACRTAASTLEPALAAVAAAHRRPRTIRLGGLTVPTGAALDLIVGVLEGAPPPGADPAAVAKWWDALSPDERAAWIKTAPQVVGNLDGVPLTLRVRANRLAIQALVDSLPEGDPLLATLSQFLKRGTRTVDPKRQIIAFDPSGDGRLAELFGDLAAARHVAVIVPGMGSKMDNFWRGVGKDARALFKATPGSAVIAWTGYDAPAGAETGRVWEVAMPGQAVAGGAALVPFLTALRLDRPVPTTLIGHSYGSLTVGQSLLQGARVDRVVFIGSPGTGVQHVSQFPAGAAREVYAGEVDGDPVARLERFGEAPTDPDFGAFAYDAGSPDSLSPLARHSEYFDEGTALENLSTIVSGGSPSAERAGLVERGVESTEDLRDGYHRIVDWAQDEIDVPVIDPLLDAAVDGRQSLLRGAGQVAEVVVETAGTYATEGAEWAWDRGGDVVDGAGDVVDRARDLLDRAGDVLVPDFDRITSWR